MSMRMRKLHLRRKLKTYTKLPSFAFQIYMILSKNKLLINSILCIFRLKKFISYTVGIRYNNLEIQTKPYMR